MDFLAASERLVSEFDTIMADTLAAGQHLSGEVVVASVPSLASSLVGPVMTRFKEIYQGLTIKLFDGDEHHVAHRVRIHQADFGLCGRSEDNPDLDFQPLVQDDFCAIFPQGHPLGDMPRVRLRDLKSHPFLAMGRDTGVRRALENALVRSDLRFNVLCELEQISTLSGMIEAGIGVSAVPALTLPIVRHRNIVARRLVDPVVRRELGIVSHRRRSLSPAAESFRNAVLEFLSDGWLESIIDAVGDDTVRLLPATKKHVAAQA
jgi:DNA-binding transcriptional LysR family regulator